MISITRHVKQNHVQADDLAGKVYGVNTGLASLDDPDSGGTGNEYLTFAFWLVTQLL